MFHFFVEIISKGVLVHVRDVLIFLARFVLQVTGLQLVKKMTLQRIDKNVDEV